MSEYGAGGLGSVDFWRRMREGFVRPSGVLVGSGRGGGGGGGGGWGSVDERPSFGLHSRPVYSGEGGFSGRDLLMLEGGGRERLLPADVPGPLGNQSAGIYDRIGQRRRLEANYSLGKGGPRYHIGGSFRDSETLPMLGSEVGLDRVQPEVGRTDGARLPMSPLMPFGIGTDVGVGSLERRGGGMPEVGAGGELLPGLGRQSLGGPYGNARVRGWLPERLEMSKAGIFDLPEVPGAPDRGAGGGREAVGVGGSAMAPGAAVEDPLGLGVGDPRRMRAGRIGPSVPVVTGDGPGMGRAAVGGNQYGSVMVDSVTGVGTVPGGGFSRGEVRGLSDPLGIGDPRRRGVVKAERDAYADAAERQAIIDSVNAGLIDELAGVRDRLAGDGYRAEGAAMADGDIARMGRASAGGYNPVAGVGGGGVMRRGVFTPGPAMADVPERESDRQLREWDAGVEARLAALNLERGVAMDAARDARVTPEAIAAGRQRAIGRRGLTGDPVLTADQFMNARKDISDDQRRAYFDRLAARDARDAIAQERRFARAQERAGTVFGADGQVDRQASALARLNMVNPGMVADMGIRQQEAEARGGIDRMNAEANLRIGQARAIEAGMDPAVVAGAGAVDGAAADPRVRIAERVDAGLRLDELGDDTRAAQIDGILANVFTLPDGEQADAIRDFGLREDHLEEIIADAQPGPLDAISFQSTIDDKRRKAAMAQKALDRLRGTSRNQGQGGEALTPEADMQARIDALFPPSQSSIVAERNRQERMRDRQLRFEESRRRQQGA